MRLTKNAHQTSANSDVILNLNIKVRLKISVFLTALVMIFQIFIHTLELFYGLLQAT